MNDRELDGAIWPDSMRFSSNRAPKIALVIPVYNEERNIEQVILDVQRLKQIRRHWEIKEIVVNDGSTDQTSAILEGLQERFKIQVISLPHNSGIGSAVRAGFRSAEEWKADVVLQLDGDGQHPADQIPSIVCPVLSKKTDVAVGSRYVSRAGGNVSTHFRRMGTWFFSILLRVLVGIRIRDTTSGFRAFSREAAQFISDYYASDYPEVKTYVQLARAKFRVCEVPVFMKPRKWGASSITPLQCVSYMIRVGFGTIVATLRPLPAHVSRANPGEGTSSIVR